MEALELLNVTCLWNTSCINGDLWNETLASIDSMNNSNLPDSKFLFSLPLWRQLLWTILYTGIVSIATIGNLVVIWIVLADRRMRTVTNYFLVNLSIADTMVSTLNVIFNFTYMLFNNWPYGNYYCKFSYFVAVFSVCGSVFTLMAIAIERYMAIMHPLRPRMGKMMTICIAIGIWMVSFFLSLPMVLFATTHTFLYNNGNTRVICFLQWPDGETNTSYHEYIYNVTLMIVTYFLPTIAMGFAYTTVGLELWYSRGIGEYTDHQIDNIRSKRRVVKMMMVVVTIFAVCWLPYHVYFIISWHQPAIHTSDYIQELYLAIYWLAMSNSMYNPIIYCWMNKRFRKGFQRVFFWWCRCFRPSDHLVRQQANANAPWASYPGSPDHPARNGRNGASVVQLQQFNTNARDRWDNRYPPYKSDGENRQRYNDSSFA